MFVRHYSLLGRSPAEQSTGLNRQRSGLLSPGDPRAILAPATRPAPRSQAAAGWRLDDLEVLPPDRTGTTMDVRRGASTAKVAASWPAAARRCRRRLRGEAGTFRCRGSSW